MVTMSKGSGTSDTLRSGTGYALSGEGGRALANATETWFAAAAECQREMMTFVSMRLQKDAEATREMMGCRDPADMTAVQSRWVEDTLRDYNAEMGKLMTIFTKSINGVAGPKG
jgi:Phasin protein